MRTLVMGGTEFISLHLVRELLAHGHEVTVFNRGRRAERLPAGVKTIAGDRKDHAALATRLKGHRFDGVFDITYAPTLDADVAALVAALDGQPHIVFISTGRVYDHSLPIPTRKRRHAACTGRVRPAQDHVGGPPLRASPKGRRSDHHREADPRHGSAQHAEQRDVLHGSDHTRPARARARPRRLAAQFGHVEDLAIAMAAMLGNPKSYGQAYNVMGEDTVTQVGFVELIAEAMKKSVSFRHFDPALLKSFDKPGPVFGQNLVYDCHAVHTTFKIRQDLGMRPRYTLASALAHTWEWYKREGLGDRPVDFAFEDSILAKIGA